MIRDGTTVIAPRREDEEDDEEEEEFVSRFNLPDQETEKKLAMMQNQVSTLYKEGNYKKALEIGQETLLATLDHFGMIHPATASAYVNVGLAYKQLGDFDLALEQIPKHKRLALDRAIFLKPTPLLFKQIMP